MDNYKHSLKTYSDLKSAIDTAFDDGKLERQFEIAEALKTLGVAYKIIKKTTGLSDEEIIKL